MIELTLPHLLVLGALLALLGLMYLTPKAPFDWQRPLGYVALVIGLVVCLCLGREAALLAWHGSGRAAAEQFLALYVLATATWLAWKAAKPF